MYKSHIMIETEEMDPSKSLESDIYPMTAATKLYSLICESIAEEELIPKEPESILVDPSVFTSAFKFLEKYQQKKKYQNNFEESALSHQELSQNNCRTKCLTVFSTPYDRRKPKRLEQQSTELPESVKQMMEKDAALRRLLKTGNVTISLTSKSEDNDDDDNISNSCQPMTNNNISKQNKLLSSVQKHGIGANLLKKLAKKVSTSSSLLSSFENSNSQLKSVTATTKTAKTQCNNAKVQNLFSLQTPYHEKLKGMKKVPNQSKSNIFGSDNNYYYNTNTSGTGFRLKNKTNSLENGFLIHDNLIIPSTTSASSSSSLLTKCNRKIISKPQHQIEESNNKTILKSGSSNNNVEFDPTTFLEVSFREEETIENRRKYNCPHCIKKFAWSTDLKRHILTHTGERPFKCEFCTSAFTRKFLMQKHAKKHHPEEFLASTINNSNQKMCKTLQNQTKIDSSITSTIDTTTTIQVFPSTNEAVQNSLIIMDEDDKEYNNNSISTSAIDNNYSNNMFDDDNDDEEDEETEIEFQHFQPQEQYDDDDEIQFEDVEVYSDLGNSSNCDTNKLSTYQEEDGSDEDEYEDIGEMEEQLQQQEGLPRPPPLLYHDLYSKNENINSDSRDTNENNEPGASSAPILINVFSSLHQNSGMKTGPPPLKRFKKMESDVDEEDDDNDDVEGFPSITHHHVQRKFNSLTPVQS